GGGPVLGVSKSAPKDLYFAQTTNLSWTAATLADTGSFPPDTMGAAGPTQYIIAMNGRFRSFNKTTGLRDNALDADPDVFFRNVLTPAGGSIVGSFSSDPRIRYDRLSGRWFISMIDVPYDASFNLYPNRVMLAVSSGSTVGSGSSWTLFYFAQNAVSP